MSPSLENALIDPDESAACQAFQDILINERITKSSTLPATAKAYLEAFCDKSRPLMRRRWTGLVLARLLESVPDVTLHLDRDPETLARVGAVILGPDEAEETKIVAGLIVRAGVSHGINFSGFWSERKIHPTATLFPNSADTSWMRRFQDYMDALAGLSFVSSSPGLVLLYPVALLGGNEYRWSGGDENRPNLLIESQTLTIITPASSLHEIEFVYIPLRSIKNARCQLSTLYDSQDRRAMTTPWAVVLEFASDSTSYKVNCLEYSDNDFTIILEDCEDAKECVRSIQEALHTKDSSKDVMHTTKSAVDRDLRVGRTTRQDAVALSKAGVIKFDRSQREGSSVESSQRAQRVGTEAFNSTTADSASTKSGALPKVKKTLRSSGSASVLNTTDVEFGFPDQSPSIKRSEKAQALPPPQNDIRSPFPSTTNPIMRRCTSLCSTSENRPGANDPNDKTELDVRDKNFLPDARVPRIEGESGLMPSESRLRDSDASSIPRLVRKEEQGAQRGAKRTLAILATYKEDPSSEENVSGSEFTDGEERKRSCAQSARTTARKRSAQPSPTKGVACKRKPRQSKVSARPLRSLKGSLLSNLQPTTNTTTRGKDSKTAKTNNGISSIQKPTVTRQAKHRSKAAPSLGVENLSSEAHILGQLNDSQSEHEPENLQVHSSEVEANAPSRKRTSDSTTPSTPRSKRAKLNGNATGTQAEGNELVSVKSPLIVAPFRVLEEPSSPCNNRTDRSMQAPPKPAIEESICVASPKTGNRSARSNRLFDERQTPVHQLGKRSHSDMSANLEILSSNSKPTPASPRAASTAISGHADQHQVIIEQEQGEYKIEKSDPFRRNHRKINSFTRRLTASSSASEAAAVTEGTSQNHLVELDDSPSNSLIEDSPATRKSPVMASNNTSSKQAIDKLQIRAPERVRRAHNSTMDPPMGIPTEASAREISLQDLLGEAEAYLEENADIDGDTLFDVEEPEQAHFTHLKSSPPPMDHSPSSHSSTSADVEPKTDPAILTSEAEETEWEASLQPYQRDLKDQLLRVSNRVLQHIVGKESAVDDIADTFAKDGQHSLKLLFERHEPEFHAMHKDMKQKTAKIQKATEKAISKLRKERQKVNSGGGH